MARVEIPFVVQNSTGAPQGGATVQVNIRGSGGTPATIYAQEEGTDTLPNPLTTTANGRVDGWLDEGRYSIVVSGAGITTYTQHWDSVSGGPETRRGDVLFGNIGPADQGGILLGPDPGDAMLYRSAANEIRTNSSFIIDGAARVGQARLVGTPSSLSVQDSGGAGLLRAGLEANQFTDNINAVRTALGNNATNNDALITGLTGVPLRRLAFGSQGAIFANAASGAIPVPAGDSLTVAYAGGRDTLNLSSTAADTGITIGGDVELYRSAANVLATPDTVDAGAFRQAGAALASTHLADTANIARLDATQTFTGAKTFTGGLLATAAAAGVALATRQTGDTSDRVFVDGSGVLRFGSGAAAWDSALYRNGVSELRTNSTLRADGVVTAGFGTAADTGIGAIGPGGEAGLKLGIDVTIYRSAADTARTTDSFFSGAELRAADGAAGQVRAGAVGPTGQAGLVFGTGGGANNLYLSAANTLRTDNHIVIAGNLTVLGTTTQSATQTSAGALTAAVGDTGQVRIGNVGGEPTIYFGTAEDTSLRRSAADTLRTADALIIDGYLTANAGGLFTGAPSTFRRGAAGDETISVQVGTLTRFLVRADGTQDWADSTGVVDTTLARTGVGVLRLTGTLNATVGLQVGGTALASTHLSDSAALARLAGPTFTGTVTVPILSVTTREEVIAGTAAAPTRVFAGDTDTGIYSPGADQFGISTAGTSRLTVSATGAINVVNSLTVGGTAVVLTNDSRLSDSRAPSGNAGGHLTGTYPNPSVANGVITNDHISGTAAIADTKLATISTAGKVADSAIPATIARLASPTFTGVPGAPTAAADTNTTQLATTAFVLGQLSSTNPLMNGAVAVGTSSRFARADHVHPVDTSRAPAAGSASITTLGTITTGTWQGSVIGATYIDTAIARLASPTFTGTVTIPTLSVTGAATIAGALAANGNVALGDATTDLIGFYGKAGVARQARPTTLNELVTVLVNLGVTA